MIQHRIHTPELNGSETREQFLEREICKYPISYLWHVAQKGKFTAKDSSCILEFEKVNLGTRSDRRLILNVYTPDGLLGYHYCFNFDKSKLEAALVVSDSPFHPAFRPVEPTDSMLAEQEERLRFDMAVSTALAVKSLLP